MDLIYNFFGINLEHVRNITAFIVSIFDIYWEKFPYENHNRAYGYISSVFIILS